MNWQQESDPGLGVVGEIDGSAANGSTMVVIGTRPGFDQVIWWSSNGRDWTESTLPKVTGYLHLDDVAALGSGFIAVGEGDDGNGNYWGVALTSLDGKTWLQDGSATLAGWEYYNVAVVGSTIVVVAEGSSTTATDFITSTDSGQTWSQPADPDGVFKNGFQALLATSTDFWTLSNASGGQQPQIAVWHSTDGNNWTNTGNLPNSAGAGNGVAHVAHGPLGFSVIVKETGKHEKDWAWWSADGTNWQTSDQAPYGVEEIFGDDTGFIAVGLWWPNGSGCAIDPAEAQGLTFTSTDGLIWRQMTTDGWTAKYIDELRRFGRTLIGIGEDYSGNSVGTAAGAVWTAKLPSAAADQGPVPTNPPMPGGGCGS